MTEEESKEIVDTGDTLVENTVSSINISDKKRTFIFITLVFVATLSSCDGGIIPQQNDVIKSDFGGGGETRVGLFGSIDYMGRVFGAIIFTFIMGKYNRKFMLIITLIFKAVTLFAPIIKIMLNKEDKDKDIFYYINTIARCLSGISQVFYPTYLPVWCDQYAKKEKRAIWVTLVQIGNPIGIILGYGLGMACKSISSDNGWVIAFPVEGITLIICAIIILFFDKIYFSEKFVLTEDCSGIEKELSEEEKKVNLFANLGKIVCNKIFFFSSLCNSVAFFGIGVVQFFGDKYMDLVLGIDDIPRFILFGFLCLFGPTTGMVCGGIICSKLGGYVKRKSMTFVILCMTIASFISMLVACHEIKVLFVIAGWTYLFAIGASIPPISGIIISCLDNNLRGDGFSFCNLILNLLGGFPSSYVYSLLADAFKDKGNDQYKYAWMISMGYNFIGLIFVIIAGIFRFRIKGDLSETKNEELKESNDENTNTENKEEENKDEEQKENI